jgi:hypothetical protein
VASALKTKERAKKEGWDRILDAKLGAFSVTALGEAQRPQRKLFEPEGRVFASAAERTLERSKTAYSQEESCPSDLRQIISLIGGRRNEA